MATRILKKTLLCFMTVTVLLDVFGESAFASEKEEYPIRDEKPSGQEGSIMELKEESEKYTVLPGDSLWKISEKLWGDGSYYQRMADLNQDVVNDPNLISPGMVLETSQVGYLIRKEARYGGAQMGKYSMDIPYGWTVGVTESGSAGANYVMAGDGAVACLVQDKMKETSESVRDWGQCISQISEYAEKNYPGQATDFQFEHYLMEDQGDGTGELYLYSFLWHISPEDYPGLTSQVCVGMKLTDHVQAEFIGYAFDYDIHSCVRYITASFEEHFAAKADSEFTVNDSNMNIVPKVEWGLNGMYNSFAFLDEFFTARLEKVTGTGQEAQADPREKLLKKMSRS